MCTAPKYRLHCTKLSILRKKTLLEDFCYLSYFVTLGHLSPDPLQALGRLKKREGGLRDVPDLTIVNILTHLFSRYQLPLTNLFSFSLFTESRVAGANL